MKSLILLLCMFFDSGVEEKLVVVDHVDLTEVNYKYFQSEESFTGVKRQFIQVIFWEYRENVLLPEYKEGKYTGSWKQGSDYVVIDYFTLLNQNYGLNKTHGMAPYLYKGKWYTHYYDEQDKCHRIVVSKQMRITHTLYDPEVLNGKIVQIDSRKELTKPDRNIIIKKIPQDVIDLIDRAVEVK